jgi:cyanophycinase
MRYPLYAVLVAGVGAVIYLGASLALLAQVPDAPKATVGAPMPGGSLVIVGGGKLLPPIRERFVELAGGSSAKIVIIPTANSFADNPRSTSAIDAWKDYRVNSIRLLHTRSQEQANDPEFVRPLTEATGVWFGGGRQEMIAKAYLGTEVEKQLMALLARGGVIGGTSAGAAIMSRLMIVGGRETANLGQGFDLLPGVVLDQHFLKRNRVKRLVGVVRSHPEVVGLGIDESTALVVDLRGKRLHVIGDSYVVACVPTSPKPEPPADPKSPSPPATEPVPALTRFEILKPGDEADLSGLRTLQTNAVIPGLQLDAN